MRERNPVWRRVASASQTGYHTNAVYDSRRRLVVIAGGNQLSNAIVVYVCAPGVDDADTRPTALKLP